MSVAGSSRMHGVLSGTYAVVDLDVLCLMNVF
jgi:hypothetical protein